MPQSLETCISGTYQVAGGTCSMPATLMKLAQFASASGTYAGTYTAQNVPANTPMPSAIITTVLTQSTNPSADGTFALTSTVISTGACTGKLTIVAARSRGGAVMTYTLSLAAHHQASSTVRWTQRQPR